MSNSPSKSSQQVRHQLKDHKFVLTRPVDEEKRRESRELRLKDQKRRHGNPARGQKSQFHHKNFNRGDRVSVKVLARKSHQN